MSCDLCEQLQPTSPDVFGMPRTRTLRLAQWGLEPFRQRGQSATGLSISCLHMFFFLSIYGMFFLTHPVHFCSTKLYLSTCLSHIFCHSTSSLTQRIAQLFMPVTQLRDPPAVGSRPPCPTEPLALGWRAFNFLPMRRGTGRSCFLEPQH
jgi:hypothetical protein